jgi:hypothetical protein
VAHAGAAAIKYRAALTGKDNRAGYFPLSGMISLLAVMRSGEQIEIGIVAADGTAKPAPEPCA